MDAQNWSRESLLEFVDWAKENEPGFHQLVLLLEQRFQKIGSQARTIDPREEVIRFRAARSMGFGLSDIDDIAVPSDPRSMIEMRLNFMGLYGPASPLPPHYSERIVQSDEGTNPLEDFLDFFNHRLFTLSHTIWRKYRYDVRYSRGAGDPISQRVFSLIGLQPIESPSQNQPRRATLLPQAGLLSLYSRSPSIVAGLVSHYFRVPCQIEEFIERQVYIAKEDRTALGAQHTVLGEDFVLGKMVPDVTGRFRLVLGPLKKKDANRFLPTDASHKTLVDLIALALREPLQWELRLRLEKGEAGQWSLGEGRLGWNIWLGPQERFGYEATFAPWPGYKD